MMSIKFFKNVLLFFLFIHCVISNGQTKPVLKKVNFSNEVYKDIIDVVLLTDKDSLANLNQHGIVLIKLNLTENGMTNISLSASAPDLLLMKLNLALIQVNKKWGKLLKVGQYMLPVSYDFKSLSKFNSIDSLIDRLPDLQIKIDTNRVANLPNLFELDSLKNDFGFPCILLPVLTLKYQVIDIFKQ